MSLSLIHQRKLFVLLSNLRALPLLVSCLRVVLIFVNHLRSDKNPYRWATIIKGRLFTALIIKITVFHIQHFMANTVLYRYSHAN